MGTRSITCPWMRPGRHYPKPVASPIQLASLLPSLLFTLHSQCALQKKHQCCPFMYCCSDFWAILQTGKLCSFPTGHRRVPSLERPTSGRRERGLQAACWHLHREAYSSSSPFQKGERGGKGVKRFLKILLFLKRKCCRGKYFSYVSKEQG